MSPVRGEKVYVQFLSQKDQNYVGIVFGVENFDVHFPFSTSTANTSCTGYHKTKTYVLLS